MVERVPASVRGEMTRWLLELKTGVFVGHVSADVRERLWRHVTERVKIGSAYLIHSAQNEQRFTLRAHGPTSRELVDAEGLLLVRTPSGEQG